jgi:hypothetical protein
MCTLHQIDYYEGDKIKNNVMGETYSAHYAENSVKYVSREREGRKALGIFGKYGMRM